MRRLLLLLTCLTAQAAPGDVELARLPDMPDPVGRAATVAGVSEGALLVAGGTNFPAGMPWDGGKKAWHGDIFLLERPDSAWRKVGDLPRPLGHAVSLQTGRGIIVVGGADADRHHAETFLLRQRGGNVVIERLPDLPYPLAYASGAIVGDLALVVGGTRSPDATAAERLLLGFDLRDPAAGWKAISELPGPGRIMPAVGALGGRLHVFSGASLAADAEGKPVRTYLKDAWSFEPGAGWRRLGDMPRPAVAAVTPAIPVDENRLLVVAGDDGSKVGFQPRSAHPGFGTRCLRYDATGDGWSESDELGSAKPVAVAPSAPWKGAWVIPGGEIRPGVRTTQVISLRPWSPPETPEGRARLALWLTLVATVGLGGWMAARRWRQRARR